MSDYYQQPNLHTLKDDRLDESVGLTNWDRPQANQPPYTNGAEFLSSGMFLKQKGNPTEKFKQLQREYDMMRNLAIDRQELKLTIDASDNSSLQEDQSVSNASSRKSKQSAAKAAYSNNELKFLVMEKAKLQAMITSSTLKIEELVRRELEFKRQIHNLNVELDGKRGSNPEQDAKVKASRKAEQDAIDSATTLRTENDRLKAANKTLTEKIGQLQGTLAVKQQQCKRYNAEQRKLDELLRLERIKYQNLEIDFKKTKMEAEITQKDRKSQIGRLSQQLQDRQYERERNMAAKISRLEAEVTNREHRYRLLLDDYQILKQESAEKNVNSKREIDVLLRRITYQGQNSGNPELIEALRKTVASTLNNYNSIEQSLRNQLEDLKREITELRVAAQDDQEHQIRISQLLGEISDVKANQKNLESQKNKLEYQFKSLTVNFSTTIQENERLKMKVNLLNSIEAEKQNHIQELQNKLLETIARPSGQIRVSESSKEDVNAFKAEITHLKELLSNVEFEGDSQHRIMKRQVADSQHRLLKTQQQAERNLVRFNEKQEQEILEVQSKLDDLQRRYDTLLLDRQAHQLNQEEDLKSLTQYANESRDLRVEYQRKLTAERENHSAEVMKFTMKLESLSKINDLFMQESARRVQLEKQLTICRQSIVERNCLNDSIHHLWMVKEAEYGRLHQLMSHIKATQLPRFS